MIVFIKLFMLTKRAVLKA